MTKFICKYFILGWLILTTSPLVTFAQSDAVAGTPEQLLPIVEEALTVGLLEAWYPKALDEAMGGFYSTFTYDWQLADNQNKMIVTQARHVWTTARAATFFPDNDVYQRAAAHGFRFLKDNMWDEQYGGFYNLVNRQGEPLGGEGYDQYKRTYGNAFGLYALAAYYALSEDPEALALAQETFRWLDRHAHDSLHGGYFPSLTRQGQVVTEDPKQDVFANIHLFYKDQNTSIHLLEAFTELYHVWPDPQVAQRLQEMLRLIRDTLVAEPGYLRMYFYRDWQAVSFQDSSQAAREAHYALDHVSFGHDIETAFLMLEASVALDSFEWDQTLQTAKKMVDHTVAHGFDPALSGIYEQGYYFSDSAITIVNKKKTWWSQAEGLNALLLFSRLYPSEAQYEQQFVKQWNYIQQYILDPTYGGWYAHGLDTEPEARYALKGHLWKGAYHDGRTLMNIVHLLRSEH